MNSSTSCRGLIPRASRRKSLSPCSVYGLRRCVQHDARHRRSRFWIPPLEIKHNELPLDSNELLVRAGFIRQAYSGIYHMLPLGLRVQSKIEDLISRHMNAIGASKLSLSSFSSQDLWQRSGRLATGSELFKFTDRKEAKWLLSPTHEEEITSLVASLIRSYRDLPVRVYQTGRKYRDERRPRGGLLRGREFVMKDLYTFDGSEEAALATYDLVRAAYRKIFDELKVPYIEARADSGNMGGNLSHEYHLPSERGEDNILSCLKCGLARNEELVDQVKYTRENVHLPASGEGSHDAKIEDNLTEFVAVSSDGSTLVKAFAKPDNATGSATRAALREINSHAVKAAFGGITDLDTGIEEPLKFFIDAIAKSGKAHDHAIHYIFDSNVDESTAHLQIAKDRQNVASGIKIFKITADPTSPVPLQLLKTVSGDPCPQCGSGIQVDTAIEVGHTFHLGTRYSAKLGANVVRASDPIPVPMQMGCHGIGVSRLIAAISSSLVDDQGLSWPRAIAPFQVIIVPKLAKTEEDTAAVLNGAEKIYDQLTTANQSDSDLTSAIDAIIDDRRETRFPAKLYDADIIGYPVIVVLGNAWAREGKVEIQCRRQRLKREIEVEEVRGYVKKILQEL